ncbi:type II toxin-antitoxin system HipA family toxin [Sulfurimonas sp.]
MALVKLYHHKINIADFVRDEKNFMINYKEFTLQNSITLSMPNSKKIYFYEYRFPPFLESFLPEGYLYEIFKNLLSKEYGYVDDYLVFNFLASNIQSRITFQSDIKSVQFVEYDIDEILQNDTNDTFSNLVKTFLHKNAISGVQPKTLALLRDKEQVHTKEYIIKTWGDEYPELALNEYFCLQTVAMAGLKIPNIKLSKNNKFLLVEKFTFDNDGIFLGFEEILSLMDKNKDEKYSGSYEQVAKVIYQFCSDKKGSMKSYYKMIVMNYLLKNGDAHLKNFGLLFNDDFSRIWLSPVYDVVNTVVYIHKDKPALMLGGKKIWWGRQMLQEFGQKSCLLSKKEATLYYDECLDALALGFKKLQNYTEKNSDFTIGKMMLDSWKSKETKGISDELVRAWKEY